MSASRPRSVLGGDRSSVMGRRIPATARKWDVDLVSSSETRVRMRADLLAGVPDRVSLYEVSPRDGLQNENATVPLRGKLRLIDALVTAGLQRIEITSF